MNCRTDKSMYAPNETVCVYVDGLPAETVSLRLILLHLEKTVLTEEIAAAEALVPGRAEADRPRVHYLNLPRRFLAGVVVDPEADEVVPGARVTAENLATGEVLATEADEFGDFWFHQVGAAGWRVYAEAEGYLTRVLEASTVDEDRNMGPIELYRAEE